MLHETCDCGTVVSTKVGSALATGVQNSNKFTMASELRLGDFDLQFVLPVRLSMAAGR